MSRHLIVIEGTDGSGKSTQAQLTYNAIVAAGADVKRLTFPRYKDDSSMLVRMYLRGDFGTHPEDVNPYAASTFYAADRYASYKTDWQNEYIFESNFYYYNKLKSKWPISNKPTPINLH